MRGVADVKLVNVVKRFGRTVAVNNVNLDIRDKEFFALLGPSGCGKTTTLRIVAGLEFPDEGKVYIGGKDVTYLDPGDRDVAMVFQNYALYPHMTVYDNIAFPIKIRKHKLKISDAEIRDRVMEVAKLLQIENLLDRKPKQLSGGQQQRVALARALVRRPKVWLMDEPLSNLDALVRVTLRAELKRLVKELGITTIYVTHDQAEAMSMADRIAVMNQGRIIQVGTPEEVYYKPNHIFIAGFVGNPPANIIECSVHVENDLVALECPGYRGVMKDEHLAESVRKERVSKVYLAVRPEHITISREPLSDAFKGKVYVVEPLGGEKIVNIALENDVRIKVKIAGMEETGAIRLSEGDEVYLKLNWRFVSIFNSETGRALARRVD